MLVLIALLVFGRLFPRALQAVWSFGVPRALPVVLFVIFTIHVAYLRGVSDGRKHPTDSGESDSDEKTFNWLGIAIIAIACFLIVLTSLLRR